MKYWILLCLLTTGLVQAESNCRGKIDLAPTFLEIASVESGKTVDKDHLTGVRGSIDYFVWKPVLVRATGISAWGNAHFQTYSLGLGICLPYQQFYFTPTAGVTYSRLRSHIDFPQFMMIDLKQTFRSFGPYVGMDVQWCFTDKWRVAVGFQYSWSHTHVNIQSLVKAKDNSKGPTWTFLLERDITKEWSVNFGAAWNRSLNHEKHGIKGQGVKLGVTYWF